MKKLNGFIGTSLNKLLLSCVFLFVVFFISFNKVDAQNNWRATVSAGVNFPTKDLGDVNLKTGFGFDVNLAYRIMPHLFLNTGWGWNHFSDKKQLEDSHSYYEETGYMAGLQFIHAISDSKLSYLIGGGGIYKHIEIENKGEIIADTGHGWGWQVDGGLSVPISPSLSLVPNIRYRSLSRDINFDESRTSAKLNDLSLGLGISWEF